MKLEQLQESIEEKKAGDLFINGKRLGDTKYWMESLTINDQKLTSLEGCPLGVNGDFACFGNKFTSLKGGPKIVDGIYLCYGGLNRYEKLTSLEGCPEYVGKVFDCDDNHITSLKGAQVITRVHEFDCANNYITSLEFCPRIIGKTLSAKQNRIENLHDIHKHLQSCVQLVLTDNPIKSHVLGLLKIEKLTSVELDNSKVEEIINKYLPLGDIFACQEELIEAGFEEYAKL
jgi:hypothetical protein